MAAAVDHVVVGGGLGGLAAAIRLAARGRRVRLYEKGPRLGGKCNRLERGGFAFDTGPSVLTLPFVLDELFAAAGRDRRDYLELVEIEPGCRYFFADGTVWDAPGRIGAFRAAMAHDFPAELAGWDRFERYLRQLWEVSLPVFLRRPLTFGNLLRTPLRLLGPALALARPGSLRAAVEAHFRDPRLVQLFSRFATYNGSDPWRAPSAFNVIAFAELGFGAWGARGGLYAVVRALERLAGELGVEVVLNHEVRLRTAPPAVELPGGGLDQPRRGVVVNADAWHHAPARAAARAEPSGSGFVVLQAMAARETRLAVHNVFFSGDYRREFREQFGAGGPAGRGARPLADPTIYVSVPAKYDPSLAPAGAEGWFILVNAPCAGWVPDWPADYADGLLATLEARGLAGARRDALWRETRAPRYFAEEYGAWQGTLYGASSNHLLAAFRRRPNRAAPGLAFCGGSAHPGGGIPLVLLSGQMAAEAVDGELTRPGGAAENR